MHEYAVAAGLVEVIRGILGPQDRPRTVRIRKGILRVLSDEALLEAFVMLTAGTNLAGAELVIEEVPVELSCPGCGFSGPAGVEAGMGLPVPILACPRCRGVARAESGLELDLVEVTVEDRGEGDGAG